ncbi:HEPN domain-containing protein [Alteraurantiacibacter buctensis]|uniref:Apea-like HEPN domain-containing protein n=1 Tax=Alteraurantiacibacter buctensis TaxID=1503981 RepID=A0A844YS27_9SPHN|nr:HEPN domain-containing protein [Alteraurantiacibacter buctensis]MXO71155.1 hypothetical protein [Alteraurantiacibacter buctensis]
MTNELEKLIGEYLAMRSGALPVPEGQHPGQYLNSKIELIEPVSRLAKSTVSMGPANGGASGSGLAGTFVRSLADAGRDAAHIAVSLVRQIGKNSYTYYDTYAISGVSVDRRISISDNIYIVPNDQAPKGWFTDHIFTDFRFPSPFGDREFRKSEDAALIIERVVSPALVDGEARTDDEAHAWEDERHRLTQLLMLSISLVTGGFSGIRNRTYTYEEDSLFGLMGQGIFGGTSRYPKGSNKLLKDGAEVAKYLQKLSDFSYPRAIELAAMRLLKSRSLSTIEDSIIDLGIAIEVLLVQGSRQEISMRAALRGAFLLSSEPVERRKLYESFRDLYNARSATVHDGETPKKFRRRLAEWDQLIDRLIKSLLARGEFPDWDTLVLGAT